MCTHKGTLHIHAYKLMNGFSHEKIYDYFSFICCFSGLPAFDPLMESVTTGITTTAQFSCNVLSNPPATVTWFFNGAQIFNNDKFTLTPSLLTISNVQLSDDGFYKCRATNSFGNNETSARLTVTGDQYTPLLGIYCSLLFAPQSW